ncbi:MAG: hypothetical protein AB7I41_22190 [Candidatus Sericytochromatia bacterium]
MFKKCFSAVLLISLLVGCQGDPDAKDLAVYIQQDLFNLETNLRAAKDQFQDVKGKNEKAQLGVLRSRVLLQLDKYLSGLKKIEPKTGLVLGLNEKGIQEVDETIQLIHEYRKALVKRDSHQVPLIRSKVDAALEDIEEWKTEIKLLAKEKNISWPKERTIN